MLAPGSSTPPFAIKGNASAWELAETIEAERTGAEGNRDNTWGRIGREIVGKKRWKRSNSLVKRASAREPSPITRTTEKHKVNRRYGDGNGFVIRKAGVPDAWRVSREADETIEARKPGAVVKMRKKSLRRATGGGPRRKKKKKKKKGSVVYFFHPLLLLPK